MLALSALLSCGGKDGENEGAEPRVDLSFASFPIRATFRTESRVQGDPKVVAVSVVASDGGAACDEFTGRIRPPAGRHTITVTLRQHTDPAWEDAKECPAELTEGSCSGEVEIVSATDEAVSFWMAKSGVVHVVERTEDRLTLDVDVEMLTSPYVFCDPIIPGTTECVGQEPDPAAPRERLRLRVSGERSSCPAACDCIPTDGSNSCDC